MAKDEKQDQIAKSRRRTAASLFRVAATHASEGQDAKAIEYAKLGLDELTKLLPS